MGSDSKLYLEFHMHCACLSSDCIVDPGFRIILFVLGTYKMLMKKRL